MGKFHVDIVGLRHHLSVSEAAELNRWVDKQKKVDLIFIREPENEADSNAIAVYVCDSDFNGDGMDLIGYVRGSTAKVLAHPFDKQNKKLVGHMDEINVEHMWARAEVKIVKVKKALDKSSKVV